MTTYTKQHGIVVTYILYLLTFFIFSLFTLSGFPVAFGHYVKHGLFTSAGVEGLVNFCSCSVKRITDNMYSPASISTNTILQNHVH